jgi:hypothetical protein
MRERAFYLILVVFVYALGRYTVASDAKAAALTDVLSANGVPTLALQLETLQASDTPYTVHFAVAVPRYGMRVDVNPSGDANTPQAAVIGADMACFAVANSNNTQLDCVPYSNIVSVSSVTRNAS